MLDRAMLQAASACLGLLIAVPGFGAPAWRAAHRGGFLCLQAEDGSLTCPGAAVPPPAGPFAQLSVGWKYACGVRADGMLSCWGADAAPPPGRYAQVDVDDRDACAVTVEGEIRCFRLPAGPPMKGLISTSAPGPAMPPPPAGAFRQVRVSGAGACALRRDGEVVCWGSAALAATPRGPFVDLSMKDGPCALRKEGLIQCWGGRRAQPGRFEALAGRCGLRADGALVCPADAYVHVPFLETLRFPQVDAPGLFGSMAGILRDGRLVFDGSVVPGLLGPVVSVSPQGGGGGAARAPTARWPAPSAWAP